MAESAETSAMAISTAACAGERVHVVALPPVPRPRKPARIVTLCANATPPHQAACKWRGPPLSGPLFHTPKYVLDSIVYSHIFTRCHVRTHEEATLHFIPYPAADLLSVDRADRVAYDAAVRKTLLDSVAWRRCGGCDHVIVTARAWVDLDCDLDCSRYNAGPFKCAAARAARRKMEAPVRSDFCLDDPFWARVIKLSVEVDASRVLYPRSVRIPNLFAVPYESALHVSSADEMRRWQRRVMAAERPALMTLITGATHTVARSAIAKACKRSNGTCTLRDCNTNSNHCRKQTVYQSYLRSQFCLMPMGDTPSRNAIFDALACGCVPIIFSAASFSYPWHVPNASELVLLAPPERPMSALQQLQLATHLATAGKFGIKRPVVPDESLSRALVAIQALREAGGSPAHMRARIVERLPHLSYSTWTASVAPPDAFTLTLGRIRTTLEARRLRALGLGLI